MPHGAAALHTETSRKAIVITGASSGIGESCALRFDRDGYRVFAGVRREEDAERLRRQASPRLEPLHLDVADRASVAQAAREVTARIGTGHLAALINNAGVALAAPLEAIEPDDLRRVFDVNVFGHVVCTQAFLPLLRASRGRIVFVSSLSGRIASPLNAPYCGSKFALEALADAWRMELRDSGIAVAVLQPGPVATPIWKKSREASDTVAATLPPETRDRYQRLADAVRAWAERNSRRGIPMPLVVDAAVHAVTSDRPRTRYVIGRGSRLAVLSRLLPDRTRDKLIFRALGV